VRDVGWDDMREWFDPECNGTLPDGCTDGTALASWQAVLDLGALGLADR
jgi:hypothetical protein